MGHANPRTTYNFMKDQYFWSTMRDDVTKTTREYKECAVFNEEKKEKRKFPLIIGEAFEMIKII